MWRLSGRGLDIFFSFLSFPDEGGKSYILSIKSLQNRWLRAEPRTDISGSPIYTTCKLHWDNKSASLSSTRETSDHTILQLTYNCRIHKDKWKYPAESQTHEPPALL